MRMNETALARFWAKVHKSADGCWVWFGCRGQNGYGNFAPSGFGSKASVHRFSYEAAYGAIPEGFLVLHRCDNKLCVRPGHLFLGTHQDNARDMVSKGRSRKGETHHAARLTREDVAEIRRRYAQGGITHRALAQQYGVGQMQICRIINGVRWAV